MIEEIMKEHKQRYMIFKWLKAKYWPSLLVCWLVFVLGGSVFAFGISDLGVSYLLSQHLNQDHLLIRELFLIVFALLISIPISVGCSRFFLCGLEGELKISNIFYAFKPRCYWKVIFVEAVRYGILAAIIIPAVVLDIFVFPTDLIGRLVFWGITLTPILLLYYKYRFSPYILAQHPNMCLKEVFSISTKLTLEKRGRLFAIDLSFASLFFVGNLFFGVGGLLVAPYYEGVVAKYYLERMRADSDSQESLEEDTITKAATYTLKGVQSNE